jgi:hypothetical protein
MSLIGAFISGLGIGWIVVIILFVVLAVLYGTGALKSLIEGFMDFLNRRSP